MVLLPDRSGYPTLVQPVTVANRTVTQSTMEGILGFFLLYIITAGGHEFLVLDLPITININLFDDIK